MKKIFFVGAFGVFLFSCVFLNAKVEAAIMVEECTTSSAWSEIKINELYTATTDDWFEVYNLFDECVDLTGLEIWDTVGEDKRDAKYKTIDGVVLSPQDFFVFNVSNRLINEYDKVSLRFGDTIFDSVEYGNSTTLNSVVDGSHSLIRFPDGTGSWVETSIITPSTTNIFDNIENEDTTTTTTIDTPTTTVTTTVFSTTTLDFSGLRLNEIFPDPESGNEWVELYNIGTTTLLVDNLKVCDSRLTSCKTTTGTINNGSWLVFDLGSGFLNNSGDSAILEDSSENILDSVSFGIIGKERSYARSNEGVGSWAITTQVTPGTANLIVAPVVVSSGGSSGGSGTSKASATITNTTNSNPVTSSYYGKIVLNELLPDPDGADTNDEFIEIKNISDSEIDLSGWAIGDKDKKYFVTGKISANNFLFWRRTITNIVLNNTQTEEVFLYDTNGDFVDRIKYEKAESDQSYSRFASGWKWSDQITPGAENILEEEGAAGIVWKLKYPSSADLNEVVLFSAEESADPRGGSLSFEWDFGGGKKFTNEEVEYSFATSGVYTINISATSTAGTVGKKELKINIGTGLSLINSPILISEVASDPEGRDDQEFIEIWNSGSSTVDVSGWQIKVGAKKYQIPSQTNIAPGSCLVFYRVVTKISLNNTGGKVELSAPGESVVDVVKFGKSVVGKSYSLINGEWLLSSPTPNSVTGKIKNVTTVTTKNTSGNAVWYKKMKLIEVREQEKGTGVLTQGTVVVLPGVFGVQYFYISDGEAGVAVYQYKKDFPPIKTGDVVAVRGTVSEANGQKRINIKQVKDVDILRIGQDILPLDSELNDLEDQSLGNLVRIKGDITEKKSGYWYIDDGTNESVVYFKKGTKIDTSEFLEGQKVEVVGVLEQGKTGLQIWPRKQEDIVVIGVAKELEKPVAKNSFGTYFSAAAGAATALLLGFLARSRGTTLLAWAGRGAKAIVSTIRRG